MRMGILAKILSIAFVIVVCVVVTGVFALSQLRSVRYDSREQGTQAVVETGMGTLEYFEGLERAGELSREEAQANALAAVEAIRYGDGDYLWVHDDQLVMQMHPIKPELNGTDVSGTEDPNGVRLFVEMNEVVAADGAGFVAYEWPKPGFDDPQPKVSHVAGFEPWGWVIGSGVYIDDIDAAVAADQRVLLIGALAIAVAMAVGVFAGRSLLSQLRRIADAASQIAGGDMSVEPLPVDDNGTAGQLASSFNDMTAVLGEVGSQAERIAAGKFGADHGIPGDLGAAFDAMGHSLSSMADQLQTHSSALSASATDLIDVVDRIGQSAEVTSHQAGSAASAGDDVSARVASVASAIEQMNMSIAEVASSASSAADVTTEAVDAARTSAETIAKLGDSSKQIGSVVEVISEIAEQTNLLALNATIEAARAGAAGKGFAVVANEVKDLADQTARATEEITARIEAIQADTTSAIAANAQITETIDRINDISTSIAAAVEQQTVTTTEIGHNVEETSNSTQGIANSINDVASATERTTQSVEDTREAVDSMREVANQLNELVASTS